ncbi:MAG: transcriptional repressor [Weeksellaceae bacterium]|jgi:Fur family ferric uptake transcriptional regulator|nr:transcriptional repressor [Weeksellaceae bacterium]MDX9705246.1 transcriptional repressor [Weeksellaceae bacterium]
MKSLEKILKYREIHPTAMRLLVLDKLLKTQHALSLNELEALFDQADKITLYRTLKKFEKNKLVHSIDDGSGAVKYAVCDENCECLPEQAHLHFHCIHCGSTFCMKEIGLPQVSLPKNFKPQELSLVVKGICDRCSTK